MDNQFTPPIATQTPEQPTATDQPETTQQESQTPEVSNTPKPKKSKAKWVIIVLTLLLVGALGAFAWQYQQNQSLKDDNAALRKQFDTATAQVQQAKTAAQKAATTKAITTPSAATSGDLLPGGASKVTTTSATLSALYKPTAKLTALWIEYGTDAAKLSSATGHNTTGLGEGTSTDTFAQADFTDVHLESGKQYFYRVAATQDGKTIYSGLAGFTAAK